MNYETIEQTIELLCEKFGIAINSVALLMPSVVSYKIVSNTLMLILGISAIIVAIYFAKKAIKKTNSKDYDYWKDSDSISTSWVISAIAGLSGFVFSFFSVEEIIRWSCMPEIAFIEYIAACLA